MSRLPRNPGVDAIGALEACRRPRPRQVNVLTPLPFGTVFVVLVITENGWESFDLLIGTDFGAQGKLAGACRSERSGAASTIRSQTFMQRRLCYCLGKQCIVEAWSSALVALSGHLDSAHTVPFALVACTPLHCLHFFCSAIVRDWLVAPRQVSL